MGLVVGLTVLTETGIDHKSHHRRSHCCGKMGQGLVVVDIEVVEHSQVGGQVVVVLAELRANGHRKLGI